MSRPRHRSTGGSPNPTWTGCCAAWRSMSSLRGPHDHHARTYKTNHLATCNGDDGNIGGREFTGAEVEPFVVVSPANPDVVIGAWQQDRWSNGGSEGLVTAKSINGGRNWTVNPNTKSS